MLFGDVREKVKNMPEEPFHGFAYVHERVHPTAIESPFEHRGSRKSGWAKAVSRAKTVANRVGRPVYVDFADNMWLLWSGPVFEGQYTAKDERNLVDLRRFRGRRYMETKVEPSGREVLYPGKIGRDPRRRSKTSQRYFRDPRRPFTLAEAKKVARLLNIDWRKARYTPASFRQGLNVELEHGLVDPRTNVTCDDPVLTGKIARAHLEERADYYQRLKKVEHGRDPRGLGLLEQRQLARRRGRDPIIRRGKLTIPDEGWLVESPRKGYVSAHRIEASALRAARREADRTGLTIDVIRVLNHGQDRFVVWDVQPSNRSNRRKQ